MNIKFITKKGFEGELEITSLLLVDGVPYTPVDKQEELTERVCRLEGAVDMLLQIMQSGSEGKE